MKKARFLFMMMMVADVLLQGTNLPAQASPVPQQTTSQQSEKFADQQRNEVPDENDKAQLKSANENREQAAGRTRTLTKRRPRQIDSNLVPSPQQHRAKTPGTSISRIDVPRTVAGLEQAGSKATARTPSKSVSHHLPVPSSVVSVNGNQVKNSRDPGARLAVSGGPLTAARGTAAINGTNMKRKP